jgi:putative ABC transport system permease protein
MRRVTLRSIWEHKRRLLSTVLAVVLGVAFMSGTFIMSTTLDHSFDDLFSKVVKNVDVLVQGQVVFTDLIDGDQHATLPESTVADVRKVPGVDVAVGRVSTESLLSVSRILDAHGKPVGGTQGTTILESWLGTSAVTPYHLTSGRGPDAGDEMVLNIGAAEEGDLKVGDTVTVITQAGPVKRHLVGTFALGAAKSAGGAVTAAFTLPEAQRLAGLPPHQIQNIYVKGDKGLSQAELVKRIAPILHPPAEVITGTEAIHQLSKNKQTNFTFLKMALTIFGAIALLVGTFVISNTFSILVAQRTRELALLRALGASRAQVLGSVLLEASVIGAISAVIGLFGGLLMAKGVTAGISASGAQLPNSSLVIAPNTIVLSLVIGLVVTLLASLLPAVRATRVPPLAALRDVAVDRSNLSRGRIAAGAIGLVVGLYELSAAWRGGGATSSLPTVGVGAGLVVVAFLVIGPVVTGRSIRVLGLPLPRLRGVTGKLATENAARSPKRTSATASAVVIGVALVVFITVFAASATQSVHSQVERGISADFIITHKQQGLSFGIGIPTSVAATVKGVPGVDLVAALGFGSLQLGYPDGKTARHLAESVDPAAVATVFHPRMSVGRIQELTDGGIILDRFIVKQHHLKLGDVVTVTGPAGSATKLRLESISDDPTLLGNVALTTATFRTINPALVDVQVGGTIRPGADLDTVLKDMRHELRSVPAIDVLDRAGFIGSLIKQITSYITLVYGLLVLSVITALVGIANTLSLSINERTRELGLLRAVGMDRANVRSTVRWEALLISTLGAVVGVLMGMLLSVALVKALRGFGLAAFSFPTIGLVVVILATVALGTLASVRPARRAAGLSILDAIASE